MSPCTPTYLWDWKLRISNPHIPPPPPNPQIKKIKKHLGNRSNECKFRNSALSNNVHNKERRHDETTKRGSAVYASVTGSCLRVHGSASQLALQFRTPQHCWLLRIVFFLQILLRRRRFDGDRMRSSARRRQLRLHLLMDSVVIRDTTINLRLRLWVRI